MIACLVSSGIAFLGFYIMFHLREAAEGFIILLLIVSLIAVFLSLAFSPLLVKCILVAVLLITGSHHSSPWHS